MSTLKMTDLGECSMNEHRRLAILLTNQIAIAVAIYGCQCGNHFVARATEGYNFPVCPRCNDTASTRSTVKVLEPTE